MQNSMLKTIAASAALVLAFVSPVPAQDVTPPPAADQPAGPVKTAEAPATSLDDVPQAVKDACKGDYEKLCSVHEAGSTAARECMAGSFEKLSDPCVTAILDSPLVEQHQQDMAHAMASEQDAADGPKPATAKRTSNRFKSAHAAHGARSAHKVRAAASKSAKRVASGKRATAHKYAAGKTKRHYAHASSGPKRRSVVAHVRHGTNIAGYYVKKYTRFAFARAFR